MALQLLRAARRYSAEATSSGSGGEGGGARLRARPAHGVARARVVARLGDGAPAAVPARDVRRPARLVEPEAEERLQGDLRPVHRRSSGGRAGRRADGLRARERRRDGTAGRRGDRWTWRAARGRRRGERGVAGGGKAVSGLVGWWVGELVS